MADVPDLSWIAAGYQTTISYPTLGLGIAAKLVNNNPNRWLLMLATSAGGGNNLPFFPGGAPPAAVQTGFGTSAGVLVLSYTDAPGLVGQEWWGKISAGGQIAVLEVVKVG